MPHKTLEARRAYLARTKDKANALQRARRAANLDLFRAKDASRYARNRERILTRQKNADLALTASEREVRKQYSRAYYLAHRDEIRAARARSGPVRKFSPITSEEDRQARKAACHRRWALANKERRSAGRRAQYASNIQAKTAIDFRNGLMAAIRNNSKRGKHVAMLGCSIEELKTHIAGQFTEGMTWDNRGNGGWHIDHIRALSFFDLTDPQQCASACHYTNLQPLWEADHRRKGGEESRLRFSH